MTGGEQGYRAKAARPDGVYTEHGMAPNDATALLSVLSKLLLGMVPQ